MGRNGATANIVLVRLARVDDGIAFVEQTTVELPPSRRCRRQPISSITEILIRDPHTGRVVRIDSATQHRSQP